MDKKEFSKKIEGLFGNRYTILGNYINSKTKILVRCNICHYEWEIIPYSLYKGPCPNCNKINRKKSKDDFLKELQNTHGKKYSLVGKYKAYSKKVLMECNTCGNKWEVLPGNLIGKKSGCPECSKKMVAESTRLTHKEFLEKLNKVQPNRYTLLTKYKNAKTKVLVKCNKDEYEWETLPGNLYKGICPECGNKAKRTNEIFINEVKDKYGDEYTPLSKFITARKKVKMKHSVCGHVWEITPDKFLMQDRKCPMCYGNNLKTQAQFINEVNDKHGDMYEILGEYINSKTHVLVRCNTCANEWLVTPDNLLRGYGCPACNFSKGEIEIQNYLQGKNIDYEIQYIFDDLIGNYQPLRFDFAIIKNDELQLLIEYDGLQHYERAGYVTKDKFKIQQEYDLKKDKYCKENKIPLYRIPYWNEEHIPEIIENILKNHDV